MKPFHPLLAGTCASLLFVLPALARDKIGIHAEVEGKQVVIRAADREILRYQAEPGEFPRKDIKEIFRRGGYIQSIRTPAGHLVTDDFAEGHTHHHAIWSAWTKTEFEGRRPDFWNMGDGTGRVEFVSLGDVWSKDDHAGFTAQHRYVDMTAKPEKAALLESWKVSASSDGERHVIDIAIEQTCAGDSALKLPEYHYGGIGFRGNAAWNGVENCRFFTASGITDRNKVNTAKEPWCWVGGKVDGETCGIAILCHPGNFRAPQPIRAHPSEPFFCFAPQQAGAMEIVPGKPYTMRYRIIVADGEPDAAEAKKWAEAYAAEK